MNKVKYILILLGLFYAPQIFACENSTSSYDLHFKYLNSGEGGDVEVQITRNQNKKTYLLDDTGFLGCDLAVTKILAGSQQNENFDHSSNQDTINFFRERLKKLKRTLLPYDNDQIFSIRLKKFEELIDRNMSAKDLKELDAQWLAFKVLMTKEEVRIQAREKKSAEGSWSAKERPLNDFDLPNSLRSKRGIACHLEIGEFNIGN